MTASQSRRFAAWLSSPFSIVAAIALFAAFVALLLRLPLSLPVGPMYWDTFIYYDGINRVLDGQIPSVDFEAPVGPLNYWLASLAHLAFPSAQPVLLVHFSLLAIGLPLIAVIGREAAKSSPLSGWGLVLAYLFFAALPFDTVDFYPYPGVDGFGHYNRHGAHLIYLTAASVFFVPRRRIQAGLLAVLTLALFLSKITAFLAAGLILAFGFFAGLIAPVTVVMVTAFFVAGIGLLEVTTGITGNYVNGILLLAQTNSDSLLPRFLTVLSQRLDVAMAAGLVALAVLASNLGSSWPERPHINARVLSGRLQSALDRDWLAILVCLVAGIVYETQNTGSHAFIMIWPPMLRMLLRVRGAEIAFRPVIMLLVAMATLPTLTKTAHRAARATIAGMTYERLDTANLGPVGRVSGKDLFIRRAALLRTVYPEYPQFAQAMTEGGEPISAIIASEPDFQLLWLKTIDEAVEAVRKLEADGGRRFETIFNLDFTNPFPYLMGRHGPRGVAIGADPFRTLPELQNLALREISGPGLVLLPTCPAMTSRKLLLDAYAPSLAGHRRIALTACFDAFVK